MKTIKIGQLNFWESDNDECGKWRINKLIKYLNNFSNKYIYEYSDCLTNNCDIVFYSLYNDIHNLKKCKGNPIFIYWTDELSCGGYNWNELNGESPYKYYKQNNLSISFYNDSFNNCYFPYAFLNFYDQVLNSYNKIKYAFAKSVYIDKRNLNSSFFTFSYINQLLYLLSYNY